MIIANIATYQEGEYVHGAIRSVLGICDYVVIAEGCCVENELSGTPTDFSRYRAESPLFIFNHRWYSEAQKRTAMVETARLIADGKDFWYLTVDADEILVWGEYLPDWLGSLQPGFPESNENIVPLKRTEAFWNDLYAIYAKRDQRGKLKGYRCDITDGVNPWGHYQTYTAPSRLIHSSLIDEYVIGTYIIRRPDGTEQPLGHELCPQFPMPGEPHILHRPFYRRGERATLRLRVEDEHRYLTEKGLR